MPRTRGARIPGYAAELEKQTVLTRKAMRSLYVTGRFLDLPDELKAHPGVQARLLAVAPDMDDAVVGYTSRSSG